MAGWQDAPEVPTTGPAWQQAPELGFGDYAADAAMSLGTGLAHGASGIAGLPGLAVQGAVHAGQIVPGLGLRWSTPEEKAAGHGNIVSDQGYQETVKAVDKAAPTPGNIDKAWSDITGVTLHQPTAGLGRVAETVGELIPGAAATVATGGAAGPALLPAALRAGARYVALPTALSEGLGALGDLKDQKTGDALRTAGTIAGTLGGASSERIPQAIERGAANKAQAAFDELVRTSGRTPDEIRTALAAHPELWPADVMPNAKQALMGIGTQPGPGKAVVVDAAAARSRAMPGMATNAADAAMGLPTEALQESERLAGIARDNARVGFAAALTPIAAVDPAPVIRRIDQMLGPSFQGGRIQAQITPLPWQQELVDIRQRLSGPLIPNQPGATAIVTDPMQLHQIQSDLRNVASSLGKQNDGRAAAAVNDIRQSLIQSIDEASGGRVVNGQYQPGPYRQAQAQYADDMKTREAYASGFEFDTNRKGMVGAVEDSPAALQRWWNGANDPARPWLDPATPDERAAYQAGMRARIDQVQRANVNAIRQGKGPTDIPLNREKVAIAFGPQVADQIANDYDSLRTMAGNNYDFAGKGSQTQERAQGNKLTEVRPPTPPIGQAAGLTLGPFSAAYALNAFGHPMEAAGAALAGGAVGLGKIAANKIGRAQELGRNEELARALSTPSPGNQVLIDRSEQRIMRPGPTIEALARALRLRAGDAGWTGSGVVRPALDYAQPSQR